MNDVQYTLVTSINNGIQAVISYIPKLLAGVIIILIGIIIASLLKQIILSFFKTVRVEAMLKKYGVPEMKDEYSWSAIFAEIVRWFVIILFLIPASDVLGLPRIGTLLNELLLYLPNVFIAAVIALVGFAFAKLAYNLILASAKGLTSDAAKAVATVAQWSINIFVILVVLNQLGVASDLIRILFTGAVAMIAVAGGIAFGLGGQDTARDILNAIRKNLK
jgi:small-conductance mechanosensitive channel